MKKLITTLTLLVFAIAGMNAQEVSRVLPIKDNQIVGKPMPLNRTLQKMPTSSLEKQKANDHPSGLVLTFYDGAYFMQGTFPYISYPSTMNLPALTLYNGGDQTLWTLQLTVLINGEPVWQSEEIADLPAGRQQEIKVDAKVPYTQARDVISPLSFDPGGFERANTVTYRVNMEEYEPHNLEFKVNGSGKAYTMDDGWTFAPNWSFGYTWAGAGDEFGNLYVFEEPTYLESVRVGFCVRENPSYAPMGTTYQVRIHKIDENYAAQPYIEHYNQPGSFYQVCATHVGENTKIFETPVLNKRIPTPTPTSSNSWITNVPVEMMLEPGVYGVSVVQPDGRYLYLIQNDNRDDEAPMISYIKSPADDTLHTVAGDAGGWRLFIDAITRPNPAMAYHTDFERTDTIALDAAGLPKEMIFRTLDDGVVDPTEVLGFFTDNETAQLLGYSAHFFVPGGGNTLAAMASAFTAATRDTANRWMILPQLQVGNEDANLYWSASQFSTGGSDHYSIRLSTTGTNPEDFTELLKEATVTNDSLWQPAFRTNEDDYVVDLSAYAGQKVYIAFIQDSYNGLAACFSNIHAEGVVYLNKVGASAKPSKPVVDANVRIYPNPTQDMVYIQAENKIQRVDVFNTLGKVMKTSTSAASEINVSDLAPGAYIIRITTDKGAVGYRFIKQ